MAVGFFRKLWNGIKKGAQKVWDFGKKVVNKVAPIADKIIKIATPIVSQMGPQGAAIAGGLASGNQVLQGVNRAINS
jgi:hypothetical protein